MKLFLDDFRKPYNEEWELVKDFKEFTEWIEKNGVPEEVSLDHDIADEHYDIAAQERFQKFDYSKCTEKTGYDALKWLLDYCVDNDKEIPYICIHTANPGGRENMRCYMNSFMEAKEIPLKYEIRNIY